MQDARGLEHVHFTGVLNEMPGIYPCLSLLVMTSESEGSSLALMEAMASGLPVVAPDVGGVAEVIVNGHCGALVPPVIRTLWWLPRKSCSTTRRVLVAWAARHAIEYAIGSPNHGRSVQWRSSWSALRSNIKRVCCLRKAYPESSPCGGQLAGGSQPARNRIHAGIERSRRTWTQQNC